MIKNNYERLSTKKADYIRWYNTPFPTVPESGETDDVDFEFDA
jgi:hypothetical protein